MEQINRETGEVVTGVPPAIAAAIVAVKKQVKQLGVDQRNDHGGYNSVSVDKFYERIGPIMADAGLALLIDETESEVKAGASGKPWLFVHYSLAFMHESGVVSAQMRRGLSLPITGPQTYGAAQSYIEKQFLRQVFKIPTGDKDADDTPQGDDAPARTRQIPRRQTAAEPGAEQQEAKQRVRELMDAIDATEDAEMLLRFAEWPQMSALDELLRRAVMPAAQTETIAMLSARAAKRREAVIGSLKPFDLG